jgi:hypothetical protein
MDHKCLEDSRLGGFGRRKPKRDPSYQLNRHRAPPRGKNFAVVCRFQEHGSVVSLSDHRRRRADDLLAREYFGPRIMGTVFGAATMVSSLGMAFGPWAGGIIFDTFNDYRWLYIGSLSVGLGAMAVALAFPPPAPAVA